MRSQTLSSDEVAMTARIKDAVSYAVAKFPQLVVAGSLSGSALLMKLPVLSGLAPAEFVAHMGKAYGKFVQLPYMQAALKPIGLGPVGLMQVLTVMHLVAAALVLFPSTDIPARVAGAWAILVMAGAEYCTTQSGFLPPGVPPGFEHYAGLFSSGIHCFIGMCGLWLLFQRSTVSLGLFEAAKAAFAKGVPAATPAAAVTVQATASSSVTPVVPKATVPPAQAPAKPAVSMPKVPVTELSSSAAPTFAGQVDSRKRVATPPPAKAGRVPRESS